MPHLSMSLSGNQTDWFRCISDSVPFIDESSDNCSATTTFFCEMNDWYSYENLNYYSPVVLEKFQWAQRFFPFFYILIYHFSYISVIFHDFPFFLHLLDLFIFQLNCQSESDILPYLFSYRVSIMSLFIVFMLVIFAYFFKLSCIPLFLQCVSNILSYLDTRLRIGGGS